MKKENLKSTSLQQQNEEIGIQESQGFILNVNHQSQNNKSRQNLYHFERQIKNKSNVISINLPCRSKSIIVCISLIIGLATIVLLILGINSFMHLVRKAIPRQFQYICSPQHKLQKDLLTDKFTVRPQFRKYTPTPKSLNKDLYQFSKSIDEIIVQNKYYFDFYTKKSRGLQYEAFKRAIKLMEITHSVDFKGNLVFDHNDFYSCPQEKYLSFKKTLDQQKQYFNKHYEIDKYIHDQIRFCVYVPSYNNAQKMRLYLRNLDSVFQQQYQNYKLIYIDDHSPDGTGYYVEKYMEVNNIPKQKYTLIKNQQRKGNGFNNYNAVHNHCNLGEVILLLDGDDALIGRQVFALLNAVYQKHKPALTYGQCLDVKPHQIDYCTSEQIPIKSLYDGTYRKYKFFPTGHLKTMYVDLFRMIKKQDLQHSNGSFVDHAVDQAFMYPATQMAGKRTLFIKQLIYEYRTATGHNQDLTGQLVVMNMVCKQKVPYKPIDDLPFADNPITTHYP